MSMHYNRVEKEKNQEELKRFYDDVMKLFIDRLYIEFRYKSNTSLTDQNIDRIEKATTRIFADHRRIFDRTIQLRQGEISEAKPNASNRVNIPLLKIQEQQVQQNKITDWDQDLVHFKSHVQKVNQSIEADLPPVKQENQDKVDYTPREEGEQDSFSNIGSENVDEEFMREAEKRLSILLVGSFLPSGIKRRPKKNQTNIELENVFVKHFDGDVEIFYAKLSCELNKIQTDVIKLPYH